MKEFSFFATTTTKVKPNDVAATNKYGDFRSAAVSDRRLWAFEEEAGRDLFALDFKDMVINE